MIYYDQVWSIIIYDKCSHKMFWKHLLLIYKEFKSILYILNITSIVGSRLSQRTLTFSPQLRLVPLTCFIDIKNAISLKTQGESNIYLLISFSMFSNLPLLSVRVELIREFKYMLSMWPKLTTGMFWMWKYIDLDPLNLFPFDKRI